MVAINFHEPFEFFDTKGGKKSFAAVTSPDCRSGKSRHSDKCINGVSFCGAEGGSVLKVMK